MSAAETKRSYCPPDTAAGLRVPCARACWFISTSYQRRRSTAERARGRWQTAGALPPTANFVDQRNHRDVLTTTTVHATAHSHSAVVSYNGRLRHPARQVRAFWKFEIQSYAAVSSRLTDVIVVSTVNVGRNSAACISRSETVRTSGNGRVECVEWK